MTPGIERIAAKAARDRNVKFTSLVHHITAGLVKTHLSRVPKSTSAGIDGRSAEETQGRLQEWLPEALNQIHNCGYKAPAVRRVNIPKPGKAAKRPIGIPNVSDRAIQGATATILNGIYEQDFLDSSYGGRPNRNAHQALSQLREVVSMKRVSWVYEADLRNFFGSLNHQTLLMFLSHRIGDPRLLNLIKRWLKAGVMEDGDFKESVVGTPQGGPVSVVLSNVYLHYALDLWFERAVKPRLRGEAYLIRYLDDFVICFQYLGDAKRFEGVLLKRLSKFYLELEPSKTRLLEFGKYARQNSKRYRRKLQTIYFLGFTIYCGLSESGRFVVKMKTEKSRVRRILAKLKTLMRQVMHRPLAVQRKLINQVLVGFYRYFGVAFNGECLRGIYDRAKSLWKKTLSRRSQKGRLSWEKFNVIFSYHPFAKPKVYLSYRQMSEMAKL